MSLSCSINVGPVPERYAASSTKTVFAPKLQWALPELDEWIPLTNPRGAVPIAGMPVWNYSCLARISPRLMSLSCSINVGPVPERYAASSTKSLMPAGDSPSRRAFYEAIQLGCIPVIFREKSYGRVAQLLHQRRSRPGEVRRLVDKDGVPRDVVDHFRRGECSV
jgi:hypothetical protein